MVERASFEIMILGILRARVDLERVEVQELDALSLRDVASIGPFDV